MLYEGALLHEESSNTYLRVLRVTPLHVLLMPIGRGWPFSRGLQTASGNLGKVWDLIPPTVSSEAPDGTLVVSNATAAANSFADTVHRRIFDELNLDDVVTRAARANLLRRLQKHDPTLNPSTFYKHLRRFLEGGLNIASLTARWKNAKTQFSRENLEDISLEDAIMACRASALRAQQLGPPAAPGSIEFSTTKAGALRKRAPFKRPSRYRVERCTMRVFLRYYQRKLATPRLSFQTLYDEMRDEVFATANPYGPLDRWPLWCIPSYKTFKEYWRELIPYEKRKRSEKGDHVYDTTMRPLGQAVSRAFVAGRIGEIDATIFNVELRGDEPGAPLIGPAVVFRVRCRDTGQLLGISASLESAGWIGAAMAIANCMADKEAFCTELGLEEAYRRLPWTARGLPAELLADMGETYNHKVRPFIRLTGVSVSTLPGGRPDLKPGVESDWNVLQVKLEEVTPGAKVRRYEDERGAKWHLKGNTTLRQFTRMLVLEELMKMHRPRLDKRLPVDMVNDRVDSSPYSMFQWSVSNAGGGLKQVDELVVRLSLLPRENASVTEWGVTVRGFHFSCARKATEQAHARARALGRRTVSVAWDPLLINSVWLIIGDDPTAPEEYVRCTLDMRFRNQVGLKDKTWREALRLAFNGEVTDAARREEIDAHLAYAKHLQKQIAGEAQSETLTEREAHPKSLTRLKKESADARLIAKDQSSPGLAVTAPLNSGLDGTPAAPGERPPLYVVQPPAATPSVDTARGRNGAVAPEKAAARQTGRRDYFAEMLAKAKQEQQ